MKQAELIRPFTMISQTSALAEAADVRSQFHKFVPIISNI